jgi:hypothetical protein
MLEKRLRESDMSAAFVRHLECLGCVVYAEVPTSDHAIDLLGRCGDKLISVELKTGLRDRALWQARLNQISVDESWVGVLSAPRQTSLARASEFGVGVWRLNGDKVSVLLRPLRRAPPFHRAKEKLVAWCDQAEPGGAGGRPCLLGEGPAQDCERRVAEYRRGHPRATWAQVWAVVPNHYVNAKSMYGAFRANAERRRFRERVKMERRSVE